MLKIFHNTKVFKTQLEIEIDIEFLNSRVYTTTNLAVENLFDTKTELAQNEKFLCIQNQFQLEEYESVTDSVTFTRPRFLIALGILSFFTEEPFTPFETFMSFSGEHIDNRESKTEIFNLDGFDLLDEFNSVKSFLESENPGKKRLFYSLLDRWRKALYLEKEDLESLVHTDEITLSYFHILELLSSEYYSDQKEDAVQLINSFTNLLLEKVFISKGKALEQEFAEKRKLVESIFLHGLSVKSKTLYMLKKQLSLTDKLTDFISTLVNDRNAVAHGRQVYQDKVIFPVPPFFPLIKHKFYSSETLRILTAKTIANFIGSSLYTNEWEEMEASLPPSLEDVNKFINSKVYEKLTNKEFCEGKIDEITPFTITHYLITKKIKPKKGAQVLKMYIENISMTEEEILNSILGVVIILDSVNKEYRTKCIEIIKVASENGWTAILFSKIRDVLYYLEYQGLEFVRRKDTKIS